MTEAQANQRAEAVVLKHGATNCLGHFVADEPYCMCAPNDHALCLSCAALKADIVAALLAPDPAPARTASPLPIRTIQRPSFSADLDDDAPDAAMARRPYDDLIDSLPPARTEPPMFKGSSFCVLGEPGQRHSLCDGRWGGGYGGPQHPCECSCHVPPRTEPQEPTPFNREVAWALALDHVETALAGMSTAGHSEHYAHALSDAADTIRQLRIPDDFAAPSPEGAGEPPA